MNRRELLLGTGAALVGFSIPGWAQSFGPAAPARTQKPTRVTILRAAFDAARRRGRPLLVLVGDLERDADGARRWTYFLDRGLPPELADLALCDLVCSVRANLMREFPEALPELSAGVMAILIQADKPEFVLIPSSGPVPLNRDIEFEGDPRALWEHNAAVHRALHAAIAPDRATLEQRVARARAALSPNEIAKLGPELSIQAGSLEAHAHYLPAQVALRALDDPASARKCEAALTAEARLRWRVGRPPGARWAQRGGGCGGSDRLEGSPPPKSEVSGPCGMGFTASYSQRFLWFYAEHQRVAFEDAPKR